MRLFTASEAGEVERFFYGGTCHSSGAGGGGDGPPTRTRCVKRRVLELSNRYTQKGE